MTDQARPRRVLDASAVLRLLLRGTPEVASAIATGECSAPDLIHHEVANGLVTNARAGYVDPPTAMLLLERFRTLEVDIVRSDVLAEPALEAALRFGISAYDAVYLVLAGRREAVLVTADRRLAMVATRSQLVN